MLERPYETSGFKHYKNAIEAMTFGDTLTIFVTNNETHAQLQIIDTGKGIPKHIQKHLFHPFFTNKDTEQVLDLSYVNEL